MTTYGSAVLGQVLNKHLIYDVQTHKVAASVALTKGMLVYEDAGNGLKVVPTSATIKKERVRFLLQDAANSSGAYGDKLAESVKKGAIVVGKVQGNITVGDKVAPSTTTAGSFMSITPRTDTVANNQADNDQVIGTYLGHPGEGVESGNRPTDATDTQLGVFRLD